MNEATGELASAGELMKDIVVADELSGQHPCIKGETTRLEHDDTGDRLSMHHPGQNPVDAEETKMANDNCGDSQRSEIEWKSNSVDENTPEDDIREHQSEVDLPVSPDHSVITSNLKVVQDQAESTALAVSTENRNEVSIIGATVDMQSTGVKTGENPDVVTSMSDGTLQDSQQVSSANVEESQEETSDCSAPPDTKDEKNAEELLNLKNCEHHEPPLIVLNKSIIVSSAESSESEKPAVKDDETLGIGESLTDAVHYNIPRHGDNDNNDTKIKVQPNESTNAKDWGTYEVTKDLQDTDVDQHLSVSDHERTSAEVQLHPTAEDISVDVTSSANSPPLHDVTITDQSSCTETEQRIRARNRRLFDLFQRDQLDCISASEIITSLRAVGFNPSKAEVLSLIKKHNIGNTVDFITFSKLIREFVPQVRPAVKDALRVFDNDKHMVNVSNFRQIMMTHGECLTSDECAHMLENISTTDDETLCFEDFASALLHSTVRDNEQVW